MLPTWNLYLMVLGLVILGSPPGLEGYPADPAAAAADPAVAAIPPAAVSPVPVEPIATKSAVPVAPPQPTGGGVITEHKNPDGSTVTITRYNGPLPASAFQNPLASGLYHQGLHDNLYQTEQLLQLQRQATMLRNIQLLNSLYPIYRTPAYIPTYIYTPAAGPFLSPFFGYGYPFGYPYGGQPGVIKSVK